MVKEFISVNRIYKLNYPDNWGWNVDPESKEDTLMFFDKRNGIGILRITSIILKRENNNAASIIKNYKKEYKGSKFFKKKDIAYLTFLEETMQNKVLLKMYWWYLAKENKLIMFSFTLPKEESRSIKTKEELKIVQNMIKSTVIF